MIECSNYIPETILSKPISNYPTASPFLTDNDKLEVADIDEDASLAFLPCGSSKLLFAKVNRSLKSNKLAQNVLSVYSSTLI